MALVTWEEIVGRSKNAEKYMVKLGKGDLRAPILNYPAEAKKYFEWFSKHSYVLDKWKKLPKQTQLKRIASLINKRLNENKGKFVQPQYGPGVFTKPRAGYSYAELIKSEPYFEKGLKNYLENPPTVGRGQTAEVAAIAKMKIPLEEKWERLGSYERGNARSAIKYFADKQGKLSLAEFAPLTNFTKSTLIQNLRRGKMDLPKKMTADNVNEYMKIQRGREFVKFFKDNNIEVFQDYKAHRKKVERGGGRHVFFTDVKNNPSQLKALTGFLNELKDKPLSAYDRHILTRASREHPLYKDTSANLKSVLRAAKNNLNETIQGYNDKGLRAFLKQHPRMLKNATMWFNKETGALSYTPLSDLNKKDFNFDKLRGNLKFELEHNRPTSNYLRTMGKDGRLLAKYRALNDVEFAHNLSVDTARYNRGVRQVVDSWIEKNPTRTTEITALEKELGELGHRFYAGDKWRGRALDIKSGYRDTVLDSWSKALEKSTGLKWSDQIKNISKPRWTLAMREVTHDKNALRQLGNFLGCPRTFAAEGGRIGFQTGGTGLTACVSTKLKQPGAIEKIATLPEEVGGALGKLKNTAKGFLGMLGKGGLKAAPYAAIAAAGAVAEPLVKQFRNDDPSTYLSNPEQQKGMLLSMLESETPKVDEEILKWEYPGQIAGAAAAVPGSKTVHRARKIKGMGPVRAALGPVGKVLAGTFSPLAVAASLPIGIAAQVKGGSDVEDIATDPLNWIGPAFASSGAEMATKGVRNPLLLKALRLGMSPRALMLGSRFFGLPGLALSAGLWGYDKWKNRDSDDEFKMRRYEDDD